jgi:hypothetical protein
MNKNTKIIIGVGAAAALLFFFRKQIFGGGATETDSNAETEPETGESTEPSEGFAARKRRKLLEKVKEKYTPDTTGPSVLVDAPKDTEGTWTEPWIRTAKPPINPSVIDVNSAYTPGGNLTPRVDSAVFFSAPNPTALGGK